MPDPKVALRKTFRARRGALSPETRQRFGAAAAAHVFRSPAWRRAGRVSVYVSLPEELPTSRILAQALAEGKCLALPRLTERTQELVLVDVVSLSGLERGPKGIRQPAAGRKVSPRDVDLLLLPGIAFDHAGTRLGFGGGHFDRLLSGGSGPAWGLAFSCQITPHLPRRAHDVSVAGVVTEQGFSPAGQVSSRVSENPFR